MLDSTSKSPPFLTVEKLWTEICQLISLSSHVSSE